MKKLVLSALTIGVVGVVAVRSTPLIKVFAQSSSAPVAITAEVYQTAANHQLSHPTGLFFGPTDGILYFVDRGHNQIDSYQSGMTTVLAGSGAAGLVDGTNAQAQFNGPLGVSGWGQFQQADINGPNWIITKLLVYDAGNNALRLVCIATPVNGRGTPACQPGVHTVAGNGEAGFVDGTGSVARLYSPTHGLVPSPGQYIADAMNNVIRSFTQTGNSGTVTSFNASPFPGYVDGPLSQARFRSPTSTIPANNGRTLVTDAGNYVVRAIDSSGNVSTLAGSGVQGYQDGPPSVAKFASPVSSAFDANTGYTYVADPLNNSIRRIDSSGNVITLAESQAAGFADGNGTSAAFSNPTSVALHGTALYVADTSNDAIRVIDLTNNNVVTLIQ